MRGEDDSVRCVCEDVLVCKCWLFSNCSILLIAFSSCSLRSLTSFVRSTARIIEVDYKIVYTS